MSRKSRLTILLVLLFGVIALAGALIVQELQGKISTRLQKGWVLPPLELYSQGISLARGKKIPLAKIENELAKRELQAGRDYHLETAESCAELSGQNLSEGADRCLWLKRPALMVSWDAEGWIKDIWQGEPLQPQASAGLFPQLITQFFDGQPILQQNTPLAQIPLACLQAVTAIEDRDFLEHSGVSATGILRAVIRNIKAGRWAEGGSTITQQLVKNFFLTSKKTLKRKIEEQILAVLLESQISKDQILEMYLNVIYMGQSGPYQVRGFGSAAQNYFDKPISNLALSECALLAALVNSPGRFSPFENPDNARSRRELVLKKMADAGMINESERANAATASLPTVPASDRRPHAPYFVMAALKEFQSWQIDAEEGARLYTTLDGDTQLAMVASIQKVLPQIEARIKKPSKQPLQVAALAIDVPSAQVMALVGGRDFRSTQFNRAVDSRRQIGSVVKPFVYWPLLKSKSALSAVEDSPFEWKTGRNVWKPKNYDGKSYGSVPAFFALAQSLNMAAARVGQEVGLSEVSDTLAAAGVTAEIQELPSLTLGALELSPLAVAQAYLTLARLGSSERVHALVRAENMNGEVLFEYIPSEEEALDPNVTAQLVGMMKLSAEMGTARSIRLSGLSGPFAGKTGTTSDTKDAWFVGFDAKTLIVVWVGYDDNTAMGLTGASAALPIWIDLTRSLQGRYQDTDFPWPSGVEKRAISRDELQKEFPGLKDVPETIELILPNWAS